MRTLLFTLFLWTVFGTGTGYAQCDTEINCNPPILTCAEPSATFGCAVTGNGPFTFSWMDEEETIIGSDSIISIDQAGNYTVIVTDNNGCETITEFIVESFPFAHAGDDQVLYCEESVEIGITPVYEPSIWFSGDITPIEFSTLGGTIDFEGITGYVTSSVVEAIAIQNLDFLHLYIESAVAQNGEDVCIPVTVDNFEDVMGFAFTINYDASLLEYNEIINLNPSFLWSVPANFGTPETLGEGNIAVSFFDQSLSSHNLPDGDTLFQLCFTVIGDPQDLTFEWTGPSNFSDNTPTATVTESGTYTLRVTDNSQADCWAEDEVVVNFIDSLQAGIDCAMSIADSPCAGDPTMLGIDCEADILAYLWQVNGAVFSTEAQVAVTVGGFYCVDVTTVDGCSYQECIQVSEPLAPLEIETVVTQQPNCPDDASGMITLVVSGGTPPYSYLWSNGMSVSDPSSLLPGTYSVTVVDDADCEAIAEITLEALLTANAGEDQVVYCEENAQIGTEPNDPALVYVKEDGLSFKNYEGAFYNAGYVNGYIGVNPPSPSPPTIIPYGGGYPGTVTLTIGSASATQGEEVCIPVTAENFQGGAIQQMYLRIDFNPNMLEMSEVVDVNPELEEYMDINPIVAVHGGVQELIVSYLNYSPFLSGVEISDGDTLFQMYFTVIGDPQDLTFEWSGPSNFSANTPTTTVTESGTYTLRVTDNSQPDCWVEDQVVVNFLDSLIVDIGDTLYYCEGMPYTIPSQVQGGSGSYVYSWSTGETTPEITVIPADGEQFFLTVEDAVEGCIGIDSVVMIPAPSIEIEPIEDIFICEGEVTQVHPIASGGVPDYTYQWNTGATSSVLIISNSGTYSVTITDEVGCSAEMDFDVTVYPTLQIDFPDYGPFCPGEEVTIMPEITNGLMPYNYQWSTGEITSSITISSTTTTSYILTVTDSNGCSGFGEANVQTTNLSAFPSSITCDDSGTPSDPADDVFYFNFYITGGISAGWNGLVNGEFAGANYWEVNAYGPYLISDGPVSVQAADIANPGCAISFEVEPPECELPCTIDVQTIAPLCNDNGTPTDLSDDTFTFDLFIAGTNVGGIWVSDDGFSGSYGEVFTFGPYLVGEDVELVISDSDNPGCTETVNIQSPDCTPDICIIEPFFEIVSCDDNGTPDQLDDDTYDIQFLVTGINTAGTTYTLDFLGIPYNGLYGIPTLLPTVSLSPGDYEMLVTDDNDPLCTGSTNINIIGCYDPCEGVDITLNFITIDPLCNGSADGCIEVIADGGTAPYTYDWNFGSTTNTLCNMPAGSYIVTVTDANGCTTTGEVTLNQPPQLFISLEEVQAPTCDNSQNGALVVFVTGGTQPYLYVWSNGATTVEYLDFLAPGFYSVTVTDVNGCSIIGGYNLEASTIADAGPDMELNCLTTFVTLDASASSVGPEFTYEWTTTDGNIVSGMNTLNPDVSAPGTYQLIVTNTSEPNCFSYDEVVVTANFPPDISLSVDYISCDSANIHFSPIVPGALVEWGLPNGLIVADTNPLGANQSGVYSLNLTDVSSGCVFNANVTLNLDPLNCTSLSGRLVRDTMPDCIPLADEPGLSNWLMVIEGADEVYYAVTQADGYYEQYVPAGTYEVYPLIPDNNLWLACEDNYTVTMNNPGDMAMQDIPVQELEPCPDLWVDVSMPLLRACWTRTLHINYCNDGTAIAENAFIEVTLDDYFTFQSASAPVIAQTGNTYTLDIGDVGINDCGTVIITFVVSCDVVIDQTLCAEAKIFPNEPCLGVDPLWSGASLQVTGNCEEDAVTFLVENVGTGDMPELEPCIVIEDGVMLFVIPDSLKLDASDSYMYEFPRNGSTYRLEIGQVPYHPGFSHPTAVIEGCGENEFGTFSTGFVNQFPLDDMNEFIDIECREVVASYDPNDKHGFPRGYGEGHYIYPGTQLEYLVNFQNTGNDTAFLVVIRDTLSEFLDITTVRPGGASHPYTWDIDGDNVLVFTFENILLPDSITDLEASQGFIEYKVAHRGGLPLGTVIENSAAIYFDINEPVITNTTFHELNTNFIEVINVVKDAPLQEVTIKVIPNPVQEEAQFILDGWPEGQGLFELFNSRGQQVLQRSFRGHAFYLKVSLLPEGLYFFRISGEERAQISGQIMVVR